MKLVANAKDAWRWFSMHAAAVIVVLPLAWTQMPQDVKDWVPDSWKSWVMAAMGIAVIAGRLIDQNGKSAPEPRPERVDDDQYG